MTRGRRGTRRLPGHGTDGRRRLPAAVAAAALAAALALAGCAPAAGASPGAAHALTIAEARAVYASYLAVSDAAARHGDAALGISVTADAQQDIVRAQYRALATAGTPVPRYSYRDPVFYVPAATPFAQWFLVAASRAPAAGGPSARTLMLFERSAPGDRWRLNGSAVLDRPLPALARQPDGYAVPLFINDTSLLLSPDVVGATQAAVADEGPGNPAAAVIAAGPDTTGIYAAQSATARRYAASGLYYTWLLQGASFPQYALRTADGGALVLYGMDLNTEIEHNADGAAGPPIAVPAPFGPLLASPAEVGRHAVAADWSYQYAAVDPPAAAHGAKVQVIASGGGPSYGHAWLARGEPPSAPVPAALPAVAPAGRRRRKPLADRAMARLAPRAAGRKPSGRELAATRVRMARSATDSVVNVKRSLSQISPSVCAAIATAASLRATQAASRCSGDSPESVTPSTSLVSDACAAYRSSRSAARAIVDQRSSRGSAVMRSRRLAICSRSARSK